MPLNSARVCAIRMISTEYRLLLVNVYLPFEGSDERTDDFVDQLFVVEHLLINNCDCHLITGGDFNVDFTRDRQHTTLLERFL